MRNFFLLICFSISFMGFAQQSSFDTDTEEWTALDSNTGSTPAYQATGGNPGGFIQVFDGVGGTATFYVAPAKFLGNKSAYYGGTLKFDLQVSITPNSSTAGVRLVGGGITLVKLLTPEFNLPAVAPAWTTYTLRLDESVAWRVASTTGPLATAAQIQTVLTDLTELAINGEYSTTGADGGGLDNVSLTESEVIVFNAVSPNNDLKNDFLRIDNLVLKNTVAIFNRWGNEVWKGIDYNNDTVVFTGLSNSGSELPSGTYFYKIERENRQDVKGFFVLKR
jgi:gliding motility-associated-like protein